MVEGFGENRASQERKISLDFGMNERLEHLRGRELKIRLETGEIESGWRIPRDAEPAYDSKQRKIVIGITRKDFEHKRFLTEKVPVFELLRLNP